MLEDFSQSLLSSFIPFQSKADPKRNSHDIFDRWQVLKQLLGVLWPPNSPKEYGQLGSVLKDLVPGVTCAACLVN